MFHSLLQAPEPKPKSNGVAPQPRARKVTPATSKKAKNGLNNNTAAASSKVSEAAKARDEARKKMIEEKKRLMKQQKQQQQDGDGGEVVEMFLAS